MRFLNLSIFLLGSLLLLGVYTAEHSYEQEHAFHEAIRNGHLTAVQHMLATGYDPSYFHSVALYIACGHGTLDIVDTLLADPRVGPNGLDDEPLRAAASHGQTEVVRRLLAHPKLRDNFRSPLFLACHNGHLEIVKIILADSRGTMPSYMRCLEVADKHGHHTIVQAVKEHMYKIGLGEEVERYEKWRASP
jgi:ankyrin repeat protein